jgi:hypothetical protein
MYEVITWACRLAITEFGWLWLLVASFLQKKIRIRLTANYEKMLVIVGAMIIEVEGKTPK